MRRSTIFLACAASLLTTNVLACGESLFRVGKGVTFREYSAPLPGNILVVANSEAELLMAEALAAAGHDVHVVSEPGQLGAAINESEHGFDLVLAYFSQRDIVQAQVAATSIAFLPVAMEGPEEDLAEAQFGRYLPDQGNVQKFLKTIHSALRAHG